jgi:hypothetical protein
MIAVVVDLDDGDFVESETADSLLLIRPDTPLKTNKADESLFISFRIFSVVGMMRMIVLLLLNLTYGLLKERNISDLF